MEQSKYLLKYYKNNNPVIERLMLQKRMSIRITILIICSLTFFAMLIFSNASKFKGEISLIDTLVPLKIIMILSTIIGIIGLIFLIVSFISKKTIFPKVSFTIKRKLFVFLDWFSILPICVVIAFFCFSYLFIITPVSGNSMMPNIKNGEYVFVLYNKEITKGDVVVLEVNEKDNYFVDETSHYIKRIIGMPGDKIQWINGQLYVNGTIYPEIYFPDGYLDNIVTENFYGMFKYIDEKGHQKETDVIPEGYYFVMGDNRKTGESKDSRDISLIPEKNIVGVAMYHMNFIIPNGKIK